MTLGSFIKDNAWVPGVVVAVLLFLLTWLINFVLRQRDRDSKTFDYRIVADTPIFNHDARPDDLRVTYKGIDVHSPRVTRIRFKNTGKQVIESSDFEEDYEIQRGGAGILDYSIADSSTSNTQLAAISELGAGTPEYVRLKPKTLNRGDWFTVQLVYDGGAGESIRVLGRVKGETRATSVYPSKSELSALNESRNVAVALGLLFSLLAAPPVYFVSNPQNLWAPSVIVAVGLAISISGYISSMRTRRKFYEELRAGKQKHYLDV